MSKELLDRAIENKNFKFIFKNSKNLFSGNYFSKLKGSGIEFCDLKVYSFNDDVRKIDWNVTARQSEPYVREFLEEKDASHYFLIDVSGSIFNKIDEIKSLVSTLLFVCNNTSDNFSVIFVKKDFLKIVPLKKGKKHLINCIYELSNLKESGHSDIEKGIDYLLQRVKKSSIISIFSDELDFSENVLKKISALKSKNKIIFFEFFNSNELEFDLGLDVYCDSESGSEMMYDLDDDEIYEIILNFNNKLKSCEKLIRKTGAKFYLFDCKFSSISQLKNIGGIEI